MERRLGRNPLHGKPYGYSALEKMLPRAALKTAAYRLGFTMSPEYRRLALTKIMGESYVTAELLKDSVSLHLRSLDAGDRQFMKEQGMNELQYREFLYEAELTELLANTTQENNVRAEHNGALATSRLGAVNTCLDGPNYPGKTISSGPGAPISASVVQIHRNAVNEAQGRLLDSFTVLQKNRETLMKLDPREGSFALVTREVYDSTLHYLACLEDFINLTGVSTGYMPPLIRG